LDKAAPVGSVPANMTRSAPLLAVVDDDAEVRVALTRLISSAGFAVETFASGAALLDSLANHEPDCVLLDLHMPEVSGLAVQGILAQEHAGIPVIVITGHDTPDARSRALDLGATAYLCKPFDDDALLSAIDVALVSGDPSCRRNSSR